VSTDTHKTFDERALGWLLGLARARVKKQQRRLDNYELREGDDTEHYDVLAVNLTWMEDACERLEQLLADSNGCKRPIGGDR
jgi:hypothetical protein